MSCSNSIRSSFVTLINSRLKRGSLDILPSLPLDILCEIFCFLLPVDLLVLARTSKSFRHFLLKRSAAFIWRAARRNVDGLPEPPSDMSEVQYASLVFGSTCHYQGCEGKARDTVWHLRIRSCASCRPKHRPIKTDECDDYLSLCGMLACYPDNLEQFIPCGPFLNSKGHSAKGFQGHHIRAFADKLRALPLSDHQAYLDHQREATEAISRFASEGVLWQLEAKNARIMELRNKRAARAENIRERLVAAGFKEEVDYFGWDRIRKHPLINNTQMMTDKAFPSVMDQLREYMLGWRELRMEEQVYAFRRRVFVDAWLQFTTVAFHNAPGGCPYLPLPPNATIGFSESIDTVIRQSGPTSEEFLPGQLYAAFLSACEYILEWHRTTRRELASLLPGYRPDDSDEAIQARLRLATSVFQCTANRCRSGGRILAYPEILFHPCFTLATQGNGPSPKEPWGIAMQKACLVMGGPWNCTGRVQAHPRQDVLNKLLLRCGGNPGSTTAAVMDKQSLRLICLECAARHRVIKFMSWRSAVHHNIVFHPNFTLENSWLMPSSLLDFQNRSFSAVVSGDRLGDYHVCLLCPPRIPSWNTHFGLGDLMRHIKNKHGIFSPLPGKHYTFDTNITSVFFDFMLVN